MARSDPKGILHIPRRMIGRDIESIKVVIFQLNFWTIDDCKTQAGKDPLEIALDPG